MKIEELDNSMTWTEYTFLEVLAKAILLDKVTIGNNPIRVKAFKEDEI